jgi:ParB family chromosome partitioning protein
VSEKKPALGRGLADLLGASRVRAATPAVAVPITPSGAPAAGANAGANVAAGAAAQQGSGAATGSTAGSATAGSTTSGTTSNAAPRGSGDELAHLPLDVLQRGKYQPRVDMRQEALEELAISIRNQGLIQPIVVRPLQQAAAAGQGSTGIRYEIIAGERRWRAAQIAGLKTIPALIRRVPDDAAIAMALIENIQREDLNPLEEARALERLIAEFKVTHQQAADAVGRSRATVSNLLRLLELAPEVSMMVEKRELEMGHARALLGLANRRQQVQLAEQVVRDGLSVRLTEAAVRRLSTPTEAPQKVPTAAVHKVDPNVTALQQDLTDRLGAKVLIQQGSGGKGKLIVTYNSLDELDGILGHIR